MKRTVTDFVTACHVCQQSKYLASSPQGLLQPLPIPAIVWKKISMDFIIRLPKSNGFDAILVVVDRLSKYGHFIPLKHLYSTKSVVDIFVKEVVRLHGTPTSIVSDRDPLFMSLFRKELFTLQGTNLNMSTAYHPESDGHVKEVVRLYRTPTSIVSDRDPLFMSLFRKELFKDKVKYDYSLSSKIRWANGGLK